MTLVIFYFLSVLAVWLIGFRYRAAIIYKLYSWQIALDHPVTGDPFADIPEGTKKIAPLIAPETLARLKELYTGSQAMHAEFQKLFDAEAARLGLEDKELGYLSNLVSGWYEQKQFSMNLAWPIAGGRITPRTGIFGAPRDGGARTHHGVDITAPTGTPIYAAAAGRVTSAGWLGDLAGNGVVIDHGGGVVTKYFHLSRFATSAGANVGQGQVIGYVGSTGNSTGPHLHLQLHINNFAVDPAPYLSGAPIAASANAGAGSDSEPSKLPLMLALFFFVLILRR